MASLSSWIRQPKPGHFMVLCLVAGAYLGVLSLVGAFGAAAEFPWYKQQRAIIGQREYEIVHYSFHRGDPTDRYVALLSIEFLSNAPVPDHGCGSAEVRELWDGLRPEAERLGATSVMIQPATFRVFRYGWGFPIGSLGGALCVVERKPDGSWDDSDLTRPAACAVVPNGNGSK